jgi:hypothetical protein
MIDGEEKTISKNWGYSGYKKYLLTKKRGIRRGAGEVGLHGEWNGSSPPSAFT